MAYRLAGVALLITSASGFSPQHPRALSPLPRVSSSVGSAYTSPLFAQQGGEGSNSSSSNSNSNKGSVLSKLFGRFKKKKSSDAPPSAEAESNPSKSGGVLQLVKDAHNPKTYLALALFAAIRYSWCLRSMFYWLPVGFCIKWYRARYVFKIPVWDRQPNWNNVITSKEQEKELKAFTCLNCGSTLFIAKTREFFFEGDTGLSGLGCFSCGIKGKENFVMDRDRILDDVSDMDDYFEYERPLDFISRAERRKLMKEADGDEERANQILLERETTPASELGDSATDSEADSELKPKKKKKKKTTASSDSVEDKPKKVKKKVVKEETGDDDSPKTVKKDVVAKVKKEVVVKKDEAAAKKEVVVKVKKDEAVAKKDDVDSAPKPKKEVKKAPKKKLEKPKKAPQDLSDDVFDMLDMDEF